MEPEGALCSVKNWDKEQPQILEVEKRQEGNNNQKRHDELDKCRSQKPAQPGRSPGRLCGSLIIVLQENSARLVSINEKQPILSACKFLLLYNQIHL